MDVIPEELVLHLLEKLDHLNLITLGKTSSKFHRLTNENDLWKALITRYWGKYNITVETNPDVNWKTKFIDFYRSEKSSIASLVVKPEERPQIEFDWQDDKAVPYCNNCGTKFTLLNRKKHCRSCGKIFCHSCSDRKCVIPALGHSNPERVCNSCFKVLNWTPSKVKKNSLQICVFGANGCGKSSMIFKYAYGVLDVTSLLPPGAEVVVTAFHAKEVVLPSKDVIMVNVWEMAQNNTRMVASKIYKNADVCLFLYDSQDSNGIDYIESCFKSVKRIKPDIPMMLVETKYDVNKDKTCAFAEDVERFIKESRLVSTSVSAKDDLNVNTVFEGLVELVYKQLKD